MTDEPFGSARSIARPKVILRSAPFAVAALPTQVEHLLVLLAAPPRLVAHLALVHHVAGQLTERVSQDWPLLDYDREAVLLGAATHDIGKIVIAMSSSTLGSTMRRLERRSFLNTASLPDTRGLHEHTAAPFAAAALPTQVEHLLVMLADDVWKGARRSVVEDNLREVIAAATATAPWEVFLHLDELITPITAVADVRLDWHGAQLA